MDKKKQKGGRPARYGSKMSQVSVKLTGQHLDMLAHVPGENVSEKIRFLIEIYDRDIRDDDHLRSIPGDKSEKSIYRDSGR